MTKVKGDNGNKYLRSSVLPEVMDAQIISMVPVRRPLDVPSTSFKFGKVLSHSGCIAETALGFILIEYMCTNQVYVQRVQNFVRGMKEFYYKKFHFILDIVEPQTPNRPVTVRDFTMAMIDNVKDGVFNTFTHNCHHARYDTMRQYGMTSDNPDAGKHNLFYQGFVDYFSKQSQR